MTIKAYFLSLLLICSLGLGAQEENGLVKWLTFKEAQEKNKVQPRPFIIDFYTGWCGWCKHMMRTTYSNPAIAEYINSNFYPVKFDAETKDTIEYNGKTYKPLSPQPRTAHELTLKFLGDRLSYPSTVFVTNNYEYNLLSQGYLDEKALEPLLIFFTENVWQTSLFDEFAVNFKRTFTDTAFPKIRLPVLKPEELEAAEKKKPKKVIVLINAPFSNSGKVMSNAVLVDTSIAAYIKKNFYLVELDATRSDTIKIKGEKYFPTPVNNFPIHTLAFKFSNNRFSFPAVCLLDEQLNFIDVLNFYQPASRLKPILYYIQGDIYKKKSFADFMQEWNVPPKKKTK